ncbi:uncharacterized protein LOC134528880 [Bacillus rossius redtenbacheri]|uniref:uncharacterized protein LOC134528880 n=1 Tax=Bacillus rossius redtenbacheri TaxID=93214 RepID=UPI002FDEE470
MSQAPENLRPFPTPEEVRPFEKSEPRKGRPNAAGKRKRVSAIVTDTPVKKALKEEQKRAKEKKEKALEGKMKSQAKKGLFGDEDMGKARMKSNKSTAAGLKRKKKPRQYDDVDDDDDEEDEDSLCLRCLKPFSKSQPGVEWIQCTSYAPEKKAIENEYKKRKISKNEHIEKKKKVTARAHLKKRIRKDIQITSSEEEDYDEACECFGGTETYEKTAAVQFVFGTSQGILTQPGTGITRDCTAICRQTPTCAAFTVGTPSSDPTASFSPTAALVRNIGMRNLGYTPEKNALEEEYEKRRNRVFLKGKKKLPQMCRRVKAKPTLSPKQRNSLQSDSSSSEDDMSNLNSMCGDRLWAFERVVGAYLEGFDDREERNIQTKAECEKLCLLESTFTCRSAEYDESLNLCRLSHEDRRSQPNAFRRQPGSPIDYLENQCVRSLPDCRYNVRPGFSVISMDELQFAASQDVTGTVDNHCPAAEDSAGINISCSTGTVSETVDAVANRICVVAVVTVVVVIGISGCVSNVSIEVCSVDGTTSIQVVVIDAGITDANGICIAVGVAAIEVSAAVANAAICVLNDDARPSTKMSAVVGFAAIEISGITVAVLDTAEARSYGHARGFTCRAFTYAPGEKRCYLSGDDSLSLNNAPLMLKRDAIYAEKQCSISQCEDGLFTFEKVTGYFLRTAQQVGLAMAASPGITLECGARCLEAGSDCPAFILDYNAMKCFKLDRNSQGRGSELSPREGQSYFEKICLRGNVRGCEGNAWAFERRPGNVRGCEGNAWAFERRPGKQLRGHDDLKLQLVQSRRDCIEACLQERRFDCRSAEYDSQTAECRLSTDDRRSRPVDYVDAPPTVEYLENQCLPEETRCHFQSVPNSYPRYLDIVIPLVTDERECERRCLGYPDFICRSFSYYASGSQCFISGDDRASAGSDAVMSRPGTNYMERVCAGAGGDLGGGPPGRPALPPDGAAGCRPEFEKMTGYELQGQRSYRLASELAPGITVKCAQLCRADPLCSGFNLDYNRNECEAVQARPGGHPSLPIDLRQVPGIAFFEAVCLAGVTCGLAWTFERVPNYELRGFVNLQIPAVSRTQCEDRCLEERSFLCRSASYSNHRQECFLSSEDRFTQPHAFEVSMDTDYLENQCATSLSRCPYRSFQRDHQLIYTDKSLSSFSDSSCQHACDVEREFPCRSFTFLAQTGANTNQCLLSGSSAATAGSSGLQLQAGALYGEKECLSGPTAAAYPPLYVRPPGDPVTRPSVSRPALHPLEPGEVAGGPYPCRYSLTYEKVAGANYPAARREPLRTRSDIGISGECLVQCALQRQRCLAVSLEVVLGGRQRCFALDRSSDVDGGALQPAPDHAFFNKICLQVRPCAKAWAFTRVPSYELVVSNSIDVHSVQSRRQCMDECLAETRIVCRSATYYPRERVCKLSADTRRTQPESFKRSISDADYMENECAPQLANCEYADSAGRFLPYTDRYVPQTYSAAECRLLCDQEREFTCRSFNFHLGRHECFLSSDDTFAATRASLLADRAFFYSERGACSNVRVDCTQADMIITFVFGVPFEGRVYATGNPQACFEMGNGQTQLVLRISMGTQCGTIQQGRGQYVNHVVIQQNPVIMQETDKTVRVECSFDASDQTVSYAPSGSRDQEGSGISVTVPLRPSGTNIVTNTAPSPNVRMRILKRNGHEASVVGLGEELQLKIEIDPTSAFGIFVRNLEARTDNGELLTLIDNVGCPRDPTIFPELRLGHNRELSADFKAFRFPSTATVNFIATVQFCQDACERMRCNNGIQSYGKRRRRSSLNTIDMNADNMTEHQNFSTTSLQGLLPEENLENSSSIEPHFNTPESTAITLMEDNEDSPTTNAFVAHITGGKKTGEEPRREVVSSTELTSSSNTPSSNESLPVQDNDIPSELPLQLRLVVGENSIPKPTKSSNVKSVLNRPDIITGNTQGKINSADVAEDSDYVCMERSVVTASAIVLTFFNVGLISGFIFFYNVRKNQWKNEARTDMSKQCVTIPEVLFRNVYDRLPRSTSIPFGSHQQQQLPI